jgi:hypothetical protein
VPPAALTMVAAETLGAVLSIVMGVLAIEPDEPTAYTVCGPSTVPPGIVTDVEAEPSAGIVLGVDEPLSTVPPTALSSRNVSAPPSRSRKPSPPWWPAAT